ncbi:MAG: hypothetical protein N3F67_03290 [Acidilobaceae archaeon]|nr:hypothetical protein [Acidilobaceae archaeon]
MRRAISPMIATYFLVLVAVVAGAAAFAWVFGIWGNLGATETLRIYPNASLYNVEGSVHLSLLVKNTGTRDIVVMSIEIEGVGTCVSHEKMIRIEEGIRKISCRVARGAVKPGTLYLIKLRTEGGSTFQFIVRASD